MTVAVVAMTVAVGRMRAHLDAPFSARLRPPGADCADCETVFEETFDRLFETETDRGREIDTNGENRAYWKLVFVAEFLFSNPEGARRPACRCGAASAMLEESDMKRALVAFAALGIFTLAGLALVAGPAIQTTPAPATDTLPAASSTPAPLPEVTHGCADTEDLLALPEGVEAGPQQACCLDQCRQDADCFFRCGGQPGQCVMNNPCCTECVCLASSLRIAS